MIDAPCTVTSASYERCWSVLSDICTQSLGTNVLMPERGKGRDREVTALKRRAGVSERCLVGVGEGALEFFEKLALTLGELLGGGNADSDEFVATAVFAA